MRLPSPSSSLTDTESGSTLYGFLRPYPIAQQTAQAIWVLCLNMMLFEFCLVNHIILFDRAHQHSTQTFNNQVHVIDSLPESLPEILLHIVE